MLLFFYIFIFLFGLCIGSFLNCVIYRLEKKKKLTGRSYCPHCRHKLIWRDLIPVFSFIFFRRKCRYCKKSISIQYPLVELATGLLFLLIFNQYNFINLCFLLAISSFIIIIFAYDLRHYIIPDKILFPAIAITFLYRLFENFAIGNLAFIPLLNYFWAALIASGFFLFIFLISKGRWMGFGDVKLAVLMGFILGLPDVLAALFLAFLFGAIISIILMVLGKKGLKSEIPFGPFLITGTFIAMFWGQEIIQWYMRLFLF